MPRPCPLERGEGEGEVCAVKKKEVSGHRVTFCCIMPAFEAMCRISDLRIGFSELMQDRKREMFKSALISQPNNEAVFEQQSTLHLFALVSQL